MPARSAPTTLDTDELDAIAAIVDSAPPLTPAVAAQLAALLRGAVR